MKKILLLRLPPIHNYINTPPFFFFFFFLEGFLEVVKGNKNKLNNLKK